MKDLQVEVELLRLGVLMEIQKLQYDGLRVTGRPRPLLVTAVMAIAADGFFGANDAPDDLAA